MVDNSNCVNGFNICKLLNYNYVMNLLSNLSVSFLFHTQHLLDVERGLSHSPSSRFEKQLNGARIFELLREQ